MYSPFVISEFKTGLFTYLEPWISPRDSFSEAKNVFVNRGNVFSREGLEEISRRFFVARGVSTGASLVIPLSNPLPGSIEILAPQAFYKQNPDGSFRQVSGSETLIPTLNPQTGALTLTFPTAASREVFVSYSRPSTPIRAIIPFIDQNSESYGHLLVDDLGLCLFVNGQRVPGIYVDQLGVLLKAKQRNFTFSVPWEADLTTLSVTAQIAGRVTTLVYNNGFTPSGDIQALTYNATQKTISGTLSRDPVDGDWVRFRLFPTALFHGPQNLVSWDTSRNVIVMSNGQDRVVFFDISKRTLSKPFLPITEAALWAGTNQIARAQQVKFYKNRLLLLDVEIENAGGQNGRWKQSVRWSTPFLDPSTLFSHWNFVADKPYGGEYSPDTNSTVISCGEVRDKLIVWYSEDVYVMEPTGIAQNPFVFNKINHSKFSTCPFSATALDTTTQIFGSRGYLQSDGNSVSRLDLPIPDFYEKIDFLFNRRIQSYRFSGEDNRICTIFPSYASPNGECDSMLVYNFIENTFSEYSWGQPKLSCLSSIHAERVVTWGSMKNVLFRPTTANFPFISFASRVSERIPVAGGMLGEVYALRGHVDGNAQQPIGTPIDWSFKTCRLGPFIQEGTASVFGFIDIYFEGFGERLPCFVTLEIYTDGKPLPTKTTSFELRAPAKEQTFFRVQLQVSAQFIELRFMRDASFPNPSPLKLLGLILWAEAGGEIRNIGKLL